MSEPREARCMCGCVEIGIAGDPAVMAYCHCDSCRSWLGAPLHAASLWTTANVNVTKGETARVSLSLAVEQDDRVRVR